MKRTFDLVISIIALICLSPILTIISMMILIKMGRPICFKQVRPGLHGTPFTVFKFRTMSDATDGNGKLMKDELRATRLGMLLRATSLDELPQLFNVIKGELSLVGPRPLLMQYLPLYSEEQKRRHHVRPGITGWAQINGRNRITWEDKFYYDLVYVDQQSFLFDLKIILLTVKKVIIKEGIQDKGHFSIEPFKGEIKTEPTTLYEWSRQNIKD
ncbi:sugar transferase [Salipaludibacillus neizhouensis]|uniref:Sugar transferase n=1 Tax=Salipaludibacillus neizhouensis TaxID=885475 RepID=A0A3A9K6D9_9BACI|nr:sugar transferase [Salipaludibacillus neizhouensis]RKL66430.1 sugar transferase [Salipaludibacillus neizhouensis]